MANPRATAAQAGRPSWYPAIKAYGRPDLGKASWQLTNTFVPYLALLIAMAYTVKQRLPYWITLALALPAALLLVRIFIFFHDCCHGSFLPSRRANRILGYVTGILTFTPFEDWRRAHAAHHATAGDLDRRGVGDVWTLTVEEYLSAPWITRLAYRLFRHPFVMFILGPPVVFFLLHRFPHRDGPRRERSSVWITDVAILVILAVAGLTFGLRTYLLVQVPVMWIAGSLGVWLFYVQHQFEGVYWARHEDWDATQAALAGSSYYRLPKALQWLTGNIGLHHIHHIRSGIPNYNLQACCDAIPALQQVAPLTLRSSLKSPWLNLWDEAQQELISFRSLKARTQD
jgi:omega-6 fatty acid desaturase (delta-12 desaturase)